MSMELVNCSPSRTVTYKTFSGLKQRDPGAAMDKLIKTARENLFSTLRLLRHNCTNDVKVYRFSSKMIPLATHPDLEGWDYVEDVRDLLVQIGDLVREKGMRVGFHPDHYTFINSPREDVFRASMRDYEHHCRLLKAMGLDAGAKLVTHVGGGYGDREKSRELFLRNWEKVPGPVAERIALENDDRIFTMEDTLYLAEKLGLPVVFDVHHFLCNHERGSRLEELVPRFMSTWDGSGLNPKAHVSSPRSGAAIRSHHDFVNPRDVLDFIKAAAHCRRNVDIMVEAKKKDAAMFRLVGDLSEIPGIKRVDRAALQVAGCTGALL
jgi:UV DNA damage endonuclease